MQLFTYSLVSAGKSLISRLTLTGEDKNIFFNSIIIWILSCNSSLAIQVRHYRNVIQIAPTIHRRSNSTKICYCQRNPNFVIGVMLPNPEF